MTSTAPCISLGMDWLGLECRHAAEQSEPSAKCTSLPTYDIVSKIAVPSVSKPTCRAHNAVSTPERHSALQKTFQYSISISSTAMQAYRFAVSTRGASAVDVHVDGLEPVLVLQTHAQELTGRPMEYIDWLGTRKYRHAGAERTILQLHAHLEIQQLRDDELCDG